MTQLESEPEVAQIGVLPTNIPFAIPKKWKWVQLRAIGKIVGGGTPQTSISDYWDNGCIPWFTPSDLGKANGIYIEESGRKITALGLTNSSASMMPEGAVLFSSRAPIGHIALSKVKCCTNQGCKSFVANESYISPMWAYWVLRARTQDIIARASGTTFKEISGRGMADTWIPLPPLEEQMRIVTKIKQLFEQIDRAERAYSELSGPLSERFRQLCLEKAIRGKLVPQLESEPEVTQIGEAPEELPFEIPEKWKWVRLNEVGKIVGGGTPKTSLSEYWEGGTILWFTPADLGKVQGLYAFDSARKITALGLKESSAVMMPPNSILFSSRAPIGHIALAANNCCTNQGCKSYVPNIELVEPLWGYFVMKARTPDMIARASGTTFKEISGKGVGETLVPIPPIKEQRRIIAKLNELLGAVDQLEKTISAT